MALNKERSAGRGARGQYAQAEELTVAWYLPLRRLVRASSTYAVTARRVQKSVKVTTQLHGFQGTYGEVVERRRNAPQSDNDEGSESAA